MIWVIGMLVLALVIVAFVIARHVLQLGGCTPCLRGRWMRDIVSATTWPRVSDARKRRVALQRATHSGGAGGRLVQRMMRVGCGQLHKLCKWVLLVLAWHAMS